MNLGNRSAIFRLLKTIKLRRLAGVRLLPNPERATRVEGSARKMDMESGGSV
jgi:hypothetical protein